MPPTILNCPIPFDGVTPVLVSDYLDPFLPCPGGPAVGHPGTWDYQIDGLTGQYCLVDSYNGPPPGGGVETTFCEVVDLTGLTFGDLGVPAGSVILGTALTLKARFAIAPDPPFATHDMRAWMFYPGDSVYYLIPDAISGNMALGPDNTVDQLPATWTPIGSQFFCIPEVDAVTETTPFYLRLNHNYVTIDNVTNPQTFDLRFYDISILLVYSNTYTDACGFQCTDVAPGGNTTSFDIAPSDGNPISYQVSDPTWVHVTGPVSGPGHVDIVVDPYSSWTNGIFGEAPRRVAIVIINTTVFVISQAAA